MRSLSDISVRAGFREQSEAAEEKRGLGAGYDGFSAGKPDGETALIRDNGGELHAVAGFRDPEQREQFRGGGAQFFGQC